MAATVGCNRNAVVFGLPADFFYTAWHTQAGPTKS